MPYDTDEIVSSGLKGAEESWKAEYGDAMECRDLEDKIQSGLRLFSFFRMIDESWSRNVQAGNTPFSEEVARYLHGRYEWWLEPVNDVLDWLAQVEQQFEVDGAAELRKAIRRARKLAGTDINTLVKGAQQIEGGELIPLGEYDDEGNPALASR